MSTVPAKKIKEMSEAELDAHIEELKNKLDYEVKRHQDLLKELQTIRDRRKQFKAEHDHSEIERIQQLIQHL